MLLARGNQRIRSAVIDRFREENVLVLASEAPLLRVDTGVEASKRVMLGYRLIRKRTGQYHGHKISSLSNLQRPQPIPASDAVSDEDQALSVGLAFS